MTYKLTSSNWYFKLLTLNVVFWHFFPFNNSRDLHKIIQKCSCFLFLLYTVFHWSHNWSRESNTILVKTSLHLNTLNQFQIRFKTRFTTKNRNAETICHRSVFATSPLTLLPCPEHFIHRANIFFVVLSWLLIIKHKQMRFESLTIVVDDVIGFLPQRPRGTRKSSLHNVLSELWTQRNVAGCKTLNNDHYVYTCTYYQRQLFVFFSFMTDYLNFRLALAISFQGNVHTWLEETFNELNSSDIIRFETLS